VTMSKLTLHKRSKDKRRHLSSSFTRSIASIWQGFVSLAVGKQSEQSKKTLRRLVLAIGLPLLAIVVLNLLTGLIIDLAVAQDAAPAAAAPPKIDPGDTAGC